MFLFLEGKDTRAGKVEKIGHMLIICINVISRELHGHIFLACYHFHLSVILYFFFAPRLELSNHSPNLSGPWALFTDFPKNSFRFDSLHN